MWCSPKTTQQLDIIPILGPYNVLITFRLKSDANSIYILSLWGQAKNINNNTNSCQNPPHVSACTVGILIEPVVFTNIRGPGCYLEDLAYTTKPNSSVPPFNLIVGPKPSKSLRHLSR